MSSLSPIQLTEPDDDSARIAQLYRYVELYSVGDPARHSLFVLGRPPMADFVQSEEAEELLIIDPPDDATARFQLADKTAIIFTGMSQDIGLPQVQTVPNGIAHIHIGEHYIDVYSYAGGNSVLLPALGILCTGDFGSDVTLPVLAEGSDGTAELDQLLQLARLIKQHRIQFFLPRVGEPLHEKPEMLQRLAEDVAYMHQLGRVVPGLADQTIETVMEASQTLLPSDRRSPAAQAVNRANLSRMLAQKRAT